jgi:hypothetical protein
LNEVEAEITIFGMENWRRAASMSGIREGRYDVIVWIAHQQESLRFVSMPTTMMVYAARFPIQRGVLGPAAIANRVVPFNCRRTLVSRCQRPFGRIGGVDQLLEDRKSPV